MSPKASTWSSYWQMLPGKEIERRTPIVGIFPNRAAITRLVGMILAEQDDERQDGQRYFRPESMVLIDVVAEPEEVGPTLLMAS